MRDYRMSIFLHPDIISSAPSLESIKQIFKGHFTVTEFYTHCFAWDSMKGILAISTIPASIEIGMDEETRRFFNKITSIFVELCNTMGPDWATRFITTPGIDIENPTRRHYTDNELKQKGYDPVYIKELIDICDQMYPTDEDFWFKIGDNLVWKHNTLLDIRRNPATGYRRIVIHSNIYDWKMNLRALTK
jgi:hypothetical protein